jgi:hypothetical protein
VPGPKSLAYPALYGNIAAGVVNQSREEKQYEKASAETCSRGQEAIGSEFGRVRADSGIDRGGSDPGSSRTRQQGQ